MDLDLFANGRRAGEGRRSMLSGIYSETGMVGYILDECGIGNGRGFVYVLA